MEAQEQEKVISQLKALKMEAASFAEDNMAKQEQPPPPPPCLEEVEAIIGYSFKNKSLLEEAFTHSSYERDKCFSYERLEYVGDAVLNLLITKEQYFLYPNMAPGRLTRLRAANVDTEKLARVAIRHGLHHYLRHKKPLLEEQLICLCISETNGFCVVNIAKIREFSRGIMEYPLHSNGLIDAPKDLADIVESTIGAVFIDSDSSIDTVWKVYYSIELTYLVR
uniref:Putative endoribonuclease dicer-like protein n=1 Tax=Cercis chinensis TaxID=161750 RepID=U6EFG9_9FABA|nr:putative endoribonuclease dicer-like protein [Cercis chinensis]